jgi:hypothetical protein
MSGMSERMLNVEDFEDDEFPPPPPQQLHQDVCPWKDKLNKVAIVVAGILVRNKT